MAYKPVGRATISNKRKSGASNQTPLFINRTSFSGGQNTRVSANDIAADELAIAYNCDLGVPGQIDKRPGITLIANDVGTRTYALQSYYPTSGSPAIYRIEGTNTRKWTGSGNWSANLQTFTTGLDTDITQGGESGNNEVLFWQNGTDDPYRSTSGDVFSDMGTGGTSPPKSLINVFFNNRWLVLLNGFLYYSSAYPSDYSTAFSGSNGFRFSGYGGDRGLFLTRDASTTFSNSIVVFMQNAIFGISPSATPTSTDTPYTITTEFGAIDRKCICQMGDDIAFLAPDGIRAIKRSVQDKLQFGVSYPLSFKLKDEFDNINWAQSSKFHMVWWRDKLFFFFVQTPGTDINRAWVYWPAVDDGSGKGWAVITGWTVTATAKFFKSGQELLYGGSTDGKVYQLWTASDDNGSAVDFKIQTREEDFDLPQIYKSGGELELVMNAVGNYTITVSVAIDGGSMTTLGTVTLSSSAPSLPQNLPFNLNNSTGARVFKKFHLDSLGRFKRIQFQIEFNGTSSTDIIRLLEYSVTSFKEHYEEED